MKVGDYVRTKSNGIQKIDEEGRINLGFIKPPFKIIKKEELLKSSPNIIDLIEVGDYVNGYKVIDIAQSPEKALYLNDISQKGALIPVCNYQIKSIVTKEQFESMGYKVGE